MKSEILSDMSPVGQWSNGLMTEEPASNMDGNSESKLAENFQKFLYGWYVYVFLGIQHLDL